MNARWTLLLSAAPAVVLLDQLSKRLVNEALPLGASLPVVPGLFNLVNIRNRGAAFGFLNRSDKDWQPLLYLGCTLLAVVVDLNLKKQSGRAPLLWTGLSLVLGGALANLWDRLSERAVTDFLDFYLGDAHWPAFNVADIAICVGAGLTCLAILLGHDRRGLPEEKGKPERTAP